MTNDLDLLRRIASPLRLGQTLAKDLFGQMVEFRADPWHHVAELAVMRAIADRDNERYVKMNAPPQVSKSSTVEVLTPMWALANWPDTRVILVAYSDDLAIRSGAKVRDIFATRGMELFGLTVDPKMDSKQEWRIAGHQGGMLSVGISSRVTGQPGDLIIVGDVIKNMEEAASIKTKETQWNDFNGSIYTRLQPGGTIIVTATRFSEDDITGRIDEQMRSENYDGDIWESYNFKAIAEPDYDDPNGADPEWRDVLGRVRGEPLKTRFSRPGEEENPELWQNSFFYRRRRALMPFVFSCLYQGEPTLPEGGMFPPARWGWYDPEERPPLTSMRRSWDLAASEGSNDYTTGGKVGKTQDGDYLVLDMQRFRKGPDSVLDEVRVNAQIDGAWVPVMIEEERSGAGKTVVAFYQRELEGYTVKASPVDGTKEDRARPYSTLQQKGRVKLPKFKNGSSPDWVPAFIDEHRKMMGDGRRGKHDDQIDVVAHAINDMLGAGRAHLLDPGVRLRHSKGGLIVVDEEDFVSTRV